MGFGRIVRGLLACGVLAASLFGGSRAEATTYNVTTSSACTLVLAVKAINTHTAQGSCSAGNGSSDTINLAAGTYTLGSTLTISRSLLIDGAGVGSSIVRCNVASGGDCIVVGPSSPATLVTLKEITLDKASGQASPQVSGVYVYGATGMSASLTLQSSRVAGHTWSGVYAFDANVYVNDTTIENNTSPSSGGGVHVSSGSGQASIYTARSTINNNTSGDAGGGIYYAGNQSSQIVNTTISGNSAQRGGGVAYESPDPANGYFNLIYTTVAHNQASGTGGGVYTLPFAAGYDPNISLVGAIVADNSATTSFQDWDGYVHSATGALIDDTYGVSDFGPMDDSCRMGFDPLLDPVLRSLGGPTKVHRLLPGSVAIDQVNDSRDEDQRGVKRAQLGGSDASLLDMGAYEESRLETEIWQLASKTSSVVHTVVSNSNYSNGQGTNLQATAVNHFVTYATPAALPSANYHVVVGFKKGSNAGKFQVAAADTLVGPYTNLGAVQDGYASSSSYTSVTLPNVTFSSFGTKFIRFTVTGKNSSSSSYQVFPDYIELTRF